LELLLLLLLPLLLLRLPLPPRDELNVRAHLAAAVAFCS
jgi:hypothetical protein